MKSTSDDSGWRLVGLPDPATVALSDRNLKDQYQLFCSSMKVVEDGNAVIFEEPFGIEDISLRTMNYCISTLKLLCVFFDSNEILCCFDKISDKPDEEDEDPDRNVESATEAGCESESELRSVCKGFKTDISEFQASIDFARLRGIPQKFESVGYVKTTTHNMGSSWVQRYVVLQFSYSWDIMLQFPDSDEEVRDAFPRICGFFRLTNSNRALIEYLGNQPAIGIFDSDEVKAKGFRDDLVKAWTKFSECEDDWSDFFLQFSDAELDIIRKEFRSLASLRIKDAVQSICDEAGCSRGSFVEEFGKPTEVGYLSNILKCLDI